MHPSFSCPIADRMKLSVSGHQPGISFPLSAVGNGIQFKHTWRVEVHPLWSSVISISTGVHSPLHEEISIL